MKEVIIIVDNFNYSGSRVADVIEVIEGELPHVTFDRWADKFSSKLETMTKENVINSFSFHVYTLNKV